MTRAATPKHLWIVGIVSLLWNSMGIFDYLMTETRNEAYLNQFTPEQLEYFTSFPAWFILFWALAVWGGFLGSILLLLRRAIAYPVFLISFLSMVVTTVYSYGFTEGPELMGAAGAVFSVAIFVIALFLVLYSRAMKKSGIIV